MLVKRATEWFFWATSLNSVPPRVVKDNPFVLLVFLLRTRHAFINTLFCAIIHKSRVTLEANRADTENCLLASKEGINKLKQYMYIYIYIYTVFVKTRGHLLVWVPPRLASSGLAWPCLAMPCHVLSCLAWVWMWRFFVKYQKWDS